MIKINESKSLDTKKANDLLKKIDDFGSDFVRVLERKSSDLKTSGGYDIDKWDIEFAKKWLSKYSKIYDELAKMISSAETGYYYEEN